MHILSVLMLVAAGFLFAQSIAAMMRADPPAQQATTPTAVERFRQSQRDHEDSGERVPPLVEQAQALALYLNPPPPPAAPTPTAKAQAAASPEGKPNKTMAQTPQVKPPAATPKFELHGISFYRQKPDQSMALVLEPAGSRRWVHQGEQLGHLTIERIEGDSVVCRDETQTYTLALAPDEAVTKYARGLKDTKPAPAAKQTQNKSRGPEVPPPAPGIRQMPPARVTALLGQPS